MNDHASILAQQARENLRQTACFQAFCKSCGQQNSTARTVSSKVLGGKKLERETSLELATSTVARLRSTH